MNLIFPRKERLSLFQEATGIESWSGLKILDYGGNAGNVLRDGLETGEIVESDYTCLDVDFSAIDKGREDFPEATWIYYNRHNQVYSRTGDKFTKFPFEDNSFDILCAYSVHSHCSYEDFVFDLKEMKRVAKVVVTSVVDAAVIKSMGNKRKKDYGEVHPLWDDPILAMGYRYFINGDTVTYSQDLIPERCDFLLTQYNLDWLKEQHPEMKIVPAHSRFYQPMVVISG